MAEDRARSFMERYVIARASHFSVENEIEDMHKATLTAKSAYRHIANAARSAEPDPFVESGPQGSSTAGVSQGGSPPGATGFAQVVNHAPQIGSGNMASVPKLPSHVSLITNGGVEVPAEKATKQNWLDAGIESIQRVRRYFYHRGTKPPRALMEAEKEHLYGKAPRTPR